ncbi:hypothetical protein [Mycobacteroides abscessus]|uniref:hypothetical protein n=1 Tax=Mycobacteroides abscessus TaxID=36809 RepID=UPI0009A81A1A|nr:hypothetical protein [Mycobacteroides abscessus]SKU69953.1 Uncharacterised protein [Mycobacteroides abscessus subsp. massiliense]
MAIPPDRYDELRREWIQDHWTWSEIQRARLEKLDIVIRRRYAARYFGFWVMLVFVPVGWLLGRGLYKLFASLVPDTLRSFPIPALLWAGFFGGLPMPFIFHPDHGFIAKIAVPWINSQLAGALVIAGLYGIVEGWLAVKGTTQMWPKHLPPLAMNPVDAAAILGADDLTAPPLIAHAEEPEAGMMTPPMRSEPR